MEPATSFPAFVAIEEPSGSTIYAGEAIYRPAKPHPTTGIPAPMVGIPDDSLRTRPSATVTYQVRIEAERIRAAVVYLERVSTCWWFVLEHAPEHPPGGQLAWVH